MTNTKKAPHHATGRSRVVRCAVRITLGLFLSGCLGFAQSSLPTRPRSGQKYALVIGDEKYRFAPVLKNPINDARGIAKVLGDLGWIVFEYEDLSLEGMNHAVDEFIQNLKSSNNNEGLFYFAGHGMQLDQANILIPVDFKPTSPEEATRKAYPATRVRDLMESSGVRLRILVFDSCRDNPFLTKTRSLTPTRGLAPMSAKAEGTLIAFSTGDNNVAIDQPESGGIAAGQPGRSNGLFTGFLIRALSEPGLTISDVFRKVKRDVYLASNKAQNPFTYDNLVDDGDYYFIPPQGQPETAKTCTAEVDRAFWAFVTNQNRKEKKLFDLYLEECPNGEFRKLAVYGSDQVDNVVPDAPLVPLKPTPVPTKTARTPFRTVGSDSVASTGLAVENGKGFLHSLNPDLYDFQVVANGRETSVTGLLPDGSTQTVTISDVGSEAGLDCLARRTCDAAYLSRQIERGETTIPLVEKVLSLDIIVPVVNSMVRISVLSRVQLQAIFGPDGIARWDSIAGSGATGEVHLYVRAGVCADGQVRVQCSGTSRTWEKIIGPLASGSRVQLFVDGHELLKKLAADPQGIGFVTGANLQDTPYSKSLRMLGVSDWDSRTRQFIAPLLPDADHVATEDATLSRRIYVYTRADDTKELTKKFLDFVLSDQGQELAEAAHFVSQKIHVIPSSESYPDAADPVRKRFETFAQGAIRLSVNFRFNLNQWSLDEKSVDDVGRLRRFLDSAGTTYELRLLGHADAVTRKGGNCELSKMRAEAVKNELLKGWENRLNHRIVTEGFCESLPVSSNDYDLGRAKNRRVEVYARPASKVSALADRTLSSK